MLRDRVSRVGAGRERVPPRGSPGSELRAALESCSRVVVPRCGWVTPSPFLSLLSPSRRGCPHGWGWQRDPLGGNPPAWPSPPSIPTVHSPVALYPARLGWEAQDPVSQCLNPSAPHLGRPKPNGKVRFRRSSNSRSTPPVRLLLPFADTDPRDRREWRQPDATWNRKLRGG